MTAVLILAGLVALLALAAAPLLLPWQFHVRWLIATDAAADGWGPGAGIGVQMEEVRAVQRVGDVVWLTRAGATDRHTLSLSELSNADRRSLDRWTTAGTSLLQIVHPDSAVSLHGPDVAIVGLRPTVEIPGDLGDVVEHWLQLIGEVPR